MEENDASESGPEKALEKSLGPILGLTYGQVEELMAILIGVPDDRRGTLRSRIKQWQKMGLLSPKVGRGNRASYVLESVLQLWTHVQLTIAGLPPERAIKCTMIFWHEWRKGYLQAFYELGRNTLQRVFAVVRTDALRDLSSSDTGFAMDVEIFRGDEIAKALNQDWGTYFRSDEWREEPRTSAVISATLSSTNFDLTFLLARLLSISAYVLDKENKQSEKVRATLGQGMCFVKINADKVDWSSDQYRVSRDAGKNEQFNEYFERWIDAIRAGKIVAREISFDFANLLKRFDDVRR